MEFDSYRDEVVATAVGLVNQLTPGVDGTRPAAVPATPDERRARLGAVPGIADDPLAADEPDGFVTLAGALRDVFVACAADDVDTAAAAVNALLRRSQSAPHLIRHDDAPWHLHFHSADAGDVAQWTAGCAMGLAIVIGSGHADRLGVCTAAPCDRVYVDLTRNGTRRFCSVRCANRFTVAAHRARASGEK